MTSRHPCGTRGEVQELGVGNEPGPAACLWHPLGICICTGYAGVLPALAASSSYKLQFSSESFKLACFFPTPHTFSAMKVSRPQFRIKPAAK